MEKTIPLQDLQSFCRTCLAKCDEMKHNMQEIPISLLKILDFAGVDLPQVGNLPESICDQCYDVINNFEEFKIKVVQSSKYLEELCRLAKTDDKAPAEAEECNDLKPSKKDVNKLEADPLEDNEDFEAVLVKLEIEMQQTSSEEEEAHEDDSVLALTDFLAEKDDSCQNLPNPSKSLINESDTTSECAQIICKYGCGRKFRRAHNAESHYRFKHKHMETQICVSEDSEHSHHNETQKSVERTNSKDNDKLSTTSSKICSVCFKDFATMAGLRSHLSTHGDVRPFQCNQCNRGFNMKARLKRHIREVHEENPPEIHCKYGCGKMFTRHESAMNHYRVKHILPEKGIVPKINTYICEDCGKTFKTMHNLKEHSYIHKPHAERPFQCEQCKKRFISKRPYEIHLLRHAGIKNFECNICGLKTTTQNELRNHMNHHTKEKQVNCPICLKTYTNPDNLRRHTQIVHQGVKNYKCRFCEEKFGKPDHLKHHEMRHTGERPHKCPICGRGFIQQVALKAHMKTHNKPPKITEKAQPLIE